MKKLLFISIASILTSLTISGCINETEKNQISKNDQTQSSSETVIKIGFIGPLTGPIANYGQTSRKAVELAVKEINEKNNGTTYEIIFEDDSCDPIKAVSAFHKLINTDGVKVVLNNTCSGPTLAIAPIAEEKKIILLSALSTSKDITTAGDYIFRDTVSDSFKAQNMAEYLFKEQNIKSLAMMTINNDWGVTFHESFANNYKKLGGEIIFDESHNPETLDFRSSIMKLKNKNPEALLFSTHVNENGILLKQLKENAFEGYIFAGLDEINDPNIINIAKDAIDDVIYFPPLTYEGEEAKNFEKNYEDLFHEKPGTYAHESYDGMYLIHNAIIEKGNNPDGIRDYLYSVKNYTGASGKISFDVNGDVTKPLAIKQFEGLIPKQIGILE